MMPNQSTPKTMSSRLLTMKFMQRGAAQAATEVSSPSTPQTDEEGSAAKRRKISRNHSAPSTPSAVSPSIQKAAEIIDEDEKKRQAAIEKRAADLGDAHWVLDDATATPSRHGARAILNVVHVGYAQMDYSGAPGDGPDHSKAVEMPIKARTRFNMSRSKVGTSPTLCTFRIRLDRLLATCYSTEINSLQKRKKSDDESDRESSNCPDEEGSEDEDPSRGRKQYGDDGASRNKRARTSLSARRSEEWKKAQEFAGNRRKKEVKLNKLTSISSGGAAMSLQKPASSGFTCNHCGKLGHKAADCQKQR